MNWALSMAICIAAALLESLSGGRDVKARLGTLRMPRITPPFWLWIGIGILYYVTCLVILARVLGMRPLYVEALALILVIMALNILWSYRFFRTRDLGGSAAITVIYVPLAVSLLFLLSQRDRTAAFVLIPYLCYLFYGAWWTYEVWRRNRTESSA